MTEDNMSREIQLTQGKVAIVDDEDFDWLNQYKWHAQKDHNTWYVARHEYKNDKQITILMHREILKTPKDKLTDHRDLNGLNNQRNNLRIATLSQNNHNRKIQKQTSLFKGVGWHVKNKRWRARIGVNSEDIFLGWFVSEREAALAYDKAARKYFGEFSRTNF